MSLPDESLPPIGFIGTGRMGLPMCRRRLARGATLTVLNRTPDRARTLVDAGASLARNLADLVRRSTVIVTCLDTVEATAEVYRNHGVSHAAPGTLLIDHATITPDLSREAAHPSMPVTIAMHDWLPPALAAGLPDRDIAALRLMYTDP